MVTCGSIRVTLIEVGFGAITDPCNRPNSAIGSKGDRLWSRGQVLEQGERYHEGLEMFVFFLYGVTWSETNTE